MTTDTKNYPSNSDITLISPTHSPLPIYSPNLTLTQENDTPIECRLTFQITPQLYQQIETQALFNLKPELRGSLTNGDFQPSPNIEIEATLQPDLLPHLTKNINNPDEAITYLQNLSQAQPENPLLSTENWFALHIKQPQESGETGYRTFWYYVNPATLTKENISTEEITETMVNFFKDWADTNLSDITQNTLAQSFDQITQAFEELADTTLTATTDTLTEILEDITNTLAELVDIADEAIPEDIPANPTIFEAIVNFFTADDWAYAKIKGESVLRLAFEGKNGKCKCYAKAREKQQQFVFYSISPITAPKTKRKTLAEFLTRANAGMIIGNFELDFNSGEICYKTSIEVSEDVLSFALIKSLVYPNVKMMDKYLPGIKSLLSEKISPEEAISRIEKINLSPQSSNSEYVDNLIDNETIIITDDTRETKLNQSPQAEKGDKEDKEDKRDEEDKEDKEDKGDKEDKKKERQPREKKEKRKKVSSKSVISHQQPSPKQPTEWETLSQLTREEISKLDEIIQFPSTIRNQTPQPLIDKLKNGLKNRLGEKGEELFEKAYIIFKNQQFDSKQLRFIQRYGHYYRLIQAQLEQVVIEISPDENFNENVSKWEKMRDTAKYRLQQIAENPISVQEEIDMLIEIGEIRQKLDVAKNNK